MARKPLGRERLVVYVTPEERQKLLILLHKLREPKETKREKE